MKQYFTLGLDIYFEIDRDNNIFSFTFKDGRLETRKTVSENVLLLAEQVTDWQYKKGLERRISFFNKKFR
jgi:hypothetical protein